MVFISFWVSFLGFLVICKSFSHLFVCIYLSIYNGKWYLNTIENINKSSNFTCRRLFTVGEVLTLLYDPRNREISKELRILDPTHSPFPLTAHVS